MVKSKYKNRISVILFLSFETVLFFAVQYLLVPQWCFPLFFDSPADMLKEQYSLEEKDSVDVLFLGSSQAEYYFDPMLIYKISGVLSFNIGTGAQRIEDSYFILQETLKYYKPKAVIFDIGSLYLEEKSNPATRYILDSFRTSSLKIEYAWNYAARFPKDKHVGSFLSAFFPIYEYHDRWNELSADDFHIGGRRNLYRKGYYPVSAVVASEYTLEWINEVSSANRENETWAGEISACQNTAEVPDESAWAPQITEDNLKYFQRIIALCEKNNIQLILVKTPTLQMPQYYINAWDHVKSEEVHTLADSLGFDFIDMLYDVDLGIDWQWDTCDGGYHVNIKGAEKVSAFMADYLLNEMNLMPASCDEYARDLPLWQKVHETAYVETSHDLSEFLTLTAQRDNTAVFFVAYDDMARCLSPVEITALRDFGLQYDLDSLKYSDAFLAVMENGSSVYEAASNRRLTYSGELSNGQEYELVSCGWLAGSEGSVVIDGVEYSMQIRGINIVVLDLDSGLVIDSVAFDTWSQGEHPAIRDAGRTNGYFHVYEDYLMRRDYANGLQ